MKTRVNKLADFLERVVWTALQAAAGAAIATGFDDWSLTGKVSGIAALIASLKVITAQQVGNSGMGDAIPGGTIQTKS